MTNKTGDINKHTGLVGLPGFPGTSPVAAFNENAIENLLKTKGLLAFHARHCINYNRFTVEVGLDVSQPGIERSFLYYGIKPCGLVSQNLNFNDQLTIMSLNTSGSAVFNPTGLYLDDQSRIFMRANDLLIIPSFTELHEELTTYNGDPNWKLHYQVKQVDYMACQSQGSLEQDIDFTLGIDGEIQFTTRSPKINEVVSVVYYHMPIYCVKSVNHGIRILPSNGSTCENSSGNLQREAVYAPQLIFCDRSVIRQEELSLNWRQILEDLNWRQYLESTGP